MVAESSLKRRSSVSSSVVTTFIVFDKFYTALCLAFCVFDVVDKASHHEPVYFTRPYVLGLCAKLRLHLGSSLSIVDRAVRGEGADTVTVEHVQLVYSMLFNTCGRGRTKLH